MTISEPETLHLEIQALRQDLSSTLTAGLAAVNTSIAGLAEQHHQAVLEQTKQNATFAPRDRVDSLAERVADNTKRINNIETQHLELKSSLNAISAQLSTMSLQIAQFADRTPTSEQLDWVKQARQKAIAHAETREQLVKQLAGYLMVAIAGILLSAIGIGHFLTTLFHH